MHKFINKYVIAILGFYIFWLGLLPLALSKGVGVLCENISHNSKYKINLVKPRVKTCLTPNITLRAERVIVESSENKNNIELSNLNLKLRLLPLMSGRVHINELSINELNLVAEIKKEVTE